MSVYCTFRIVGTLSPRKKIQPGWVPLSVRDSRCFFLFRSFRLNNLEMYVCRHNMVIYLFVALGVSIGSLGSMLF